MGNLAWIEIQYSVCCKQLIWLHLHYWTVKLANFAEISYFWKTIVMIPGHVFVSLMKTRTSACWSSDIQLHFSPTFTQCHYQSFYLFCCLNFTEYYAQIYVNYRPRLTTDRPNKINFHFRPYTLAILLISEPWTKFKGTGCLQSLISFSKKNNKCLLRTYSISWHPPTF